MFSCAYVCTRNSVPDLDIDLSTSSLTKLNSDSKSDYASDEVFDVDFKKRAIQSRWKKSRDVSLKHLLKCLEHLIANRPEICIKHVKEIINLSNSIIEIEGQCIVTNRLNILFL